MNPDIDNIYTQLQKASDEMVIFSANLQQAQQDLRDVRELLNLANTNFTNRTTEVDARFKTFDADMSETKVAVMENLNLQQEIQQDGTTVEGNRTKVRQNCQPDPKRL